MPWSYILNQESMVQTQAMRKYNKRTKDFKSRLPRKYAHATYQRHIYAATWVDLEVIILSEVSQRQISYDITYMWNLKKMIQIELIYKTEIDPQTQKTNL